MNGQFGWENENICLYMYWHSSQIYAYRCSPAEYPPTLSFSLTCGDESWTPYGNGENVENVDYLKGAGGPQSPRHPHFPAPCLVYRWKTFLERVTGLGRVGLTPLAAVN